MQFGESTFLFRNEVTYRQVQNNRYSFFRQYLHEKEPTSQRRDRLWQPWRRLQTSDLSNALRFCVRVRVTGDAHIIMFLGMGMAKTRECPYHCNIASLEARNPDRVSFRKDFWDRDWGRAVHLLANLFSLSLVTVSDIFEKVYSEQFHSPIKRGDWNITVIYSVTILNKKESIVHRQWASNIALQHRCFYLWCLRAFIPCSMKILREFILRIGDFLWFAETNFLRFEMTEISGGN